MPTGVERSQLGVPQHIAARTTMLGSGFLVPLVAMLLSLVWGRVIPFNHAPDEAMHFNLALYIARHHILPVLDASLGFVHTYCVLGGCIDTYATSAPGGAVVAALFIAATHLLGGVPYQDYALHAGVFAPVVTAANPFVVAARLASAFDVGIYAFFLSRITDALLTDRYARWTARALGVCIPQVTFIGAYVNDDAFSLAAGGAMFYVIVLTVRDGMRPRRVLLYGVALAALLLAKLNYDLLTLALVPGVVFSVVRDWRTGTRWTPLRDAALSGGVGAMIGGWWFVRNAVLYGDPTGLLATMRALDRVSPGYSRTRPLIMQHLNVGDMVARAPWIDLSYRSFWGMFDYMSVALPASAYAAFGVLTALGLAGVLIAVCRVAIRRPLRVCAWQALLWVLSAGLIVTAVAFSLWSSLVKDWEPQGRYLFPALIPFVLLVAVSLHGWWPRARYRRGAFLVITGLLAGINMFALVGILIPLYGEHVAL